MIITNITEYDKRRSKVLIDEDLVIILYKGEVHKLGIKTGDDIGNGIYTGKIKPILQKRAKERLLYILKARDKTESELRIKFAKSFYPENIINETIEWGKSLNYINDRRYVSNYIEKAKNFKSIRRITMELRTRGISKELILEMINKADVNENTQIIRELKKKGYYDDKDIDYKCKCKIINYLQRKGYSYESIRKNMSLDQENFY